jgi:iron complex transport system ATP-binding protein
LQQRAFRLRRSLIMSCKAEGSSLVVKGLSWGPDAGRTIIQDISFSVASGELLAIIGANGAGKSSLLRCLFRASKLRSGSITLDGEDVRGMEARHFARKVATVLQEAPAEFPFTVHDVVMTGRLPHKRGMGWNEEDRHEVEHALEHLNLQGFSNRQFGSLSGGEKQRVLIARALAQEPRLLILDEPTNHLDIRQQLEILGLLRTLGITVITTLHDITLAARFATRVIVLCDGRMLADGPPATALDSAVIRSAFAVETSAHAANVAFHLPGKVA